MFTEAGFRFSSIVPYPKFSPSRTIHALDARTLGHLECMMRPLPAHIGEQTMPKGSSSHGSSWTARELKILRKLAKTTTATRAAKTLHRTPAATQQKAMRTGISFRRRSGTAKKK
jgi:hypothetical protein